MTALRHPVLQIPGALAFWDFQDETLRSLVPPYLVLEPAGIPPCLVNEGFFGPHSLEFQPAGDDAQGFLYLSAERGHPLSFGGESSQHTVIAWIKRKHSSYEHCQFIAGVWNEHSRRQYGLFLNLRIWDSAEQVCAHVSHSGGPTAGYGYCMDAAIGATPVPFDEWHCVAMTYDGTQAAAYLDGRLDVREPQGEPGRNPFRYAGGLNPEAADFTVGAVARPTHVDPDPQGGFRESGSVMGNPYVGLLGGLAIFPRALTAPELAELCRLPGPSEIGLAR